MSQTQTATPKLDFAGLRHQLLTPLNHIVGYSEMLLEEGRGQNVTGFDSVKQNLARIRQTAKDMVRMVDSSLGANPGKRGEKVLAELRYELAAPLHTILQAVGAVTGEYREDVNLNDVLKIGRAAAELLSFAQGGAMPVRAAIDGTKTATPATQVRHSGRVLIVDDDRSNRELLARQLRRQGHQVTEASSGPEALQVLVQSPQDIVLLDMLMPKLDGFQVLERIKSDPVRGEIPVIVISALDEVPGIARCLEMGAEDYMFKPLNPVLLAARIHSLVERKRLRDLEKRRAEEMERAYERLHLSEERLRLALRADGARIWDWDPKINRVTEGERVRSLEETLLRVHPEDRDRVRAEALAAVANRQEFHCEFRLASGVGDRWVESIGTVAGPEDGRPPRMIVVTREITARKQVEDALRKSNREFQRFAMAASHDLREPLRVVSSDLESVLQHRQSGTENARVIRGAIAMLGRMSNLISDLLDYSQMSTKRPAKQPVNTEAVLALVLSDLKLNIEETDALITHDRLPVVQADFVLLQRLFQNLISNAIKYRGKEHPRIHIAAARQQDAWLFHVSDNGVGVDPKYKEAIFGFFRRVHGGDVPGTGLGLAICRRIVERLGGEIWVEPNHRKGSVFSFTIPR